MTISRYGTSGILGVFLLVSAMKQVVSAAVSPGDMVYASADGSVIQVDPGTGEQTLLSWDFMVRFPLATAVDRSGSIFVADLMAGLVRVDAETGRQSPVAGGSLGPLGTPYGIAIDNGGYLFAVNSFGIQRLDLDTGQIAAISSGGYLVWPIGVAISDKGDLLVLDSATRQVIRVNQRTGRQSILARGGYLNNPQAIAVVGEDVFVTDIGMVEDGLGLGRVVHIELKTGRQSVLTEAGYLVRPYGIAVDATGELVVADERTITPASADYCGGIIRIHPVSREQTVIAQSQAGSGGPLRLAVVPALGSSAKTQLRH